ncbi:MAG: hypothetical protein EP306_03705 [Burkholderiales bacterium]|nr:MAG: hypothetical protein EP306_03705 [Burkholderiales bacterium]
MPDALLRCAVPALRQADALAAWVLLGWLGMRLGWSLASGLLPVVLWWAVRAGCEAAGRPRPEIGMAGFCLAALALATLASGLAGPQALPLLLLAAAAWGLWSATLSGHGTAHPLHLSRLAMGLMMGSLWLSSQWCLGPGWTDGQAVALHLGLMVGVPLLLSAGGRLVHTRPGTPVRQAQMLLLPGALLLAVASTPAAHIAGMVLLVVSSTMHLPGHAGHRSAAGGRMAGPALLLAVGLAAPTLGPVALQAAWALVALFAALQALRPLHRAWPAPATSPQRWSDAS